jgi:hypothetical protein
MIFDVKMEDF